MTQVEQHPLVTSVLVGVLFLWGMVAGMTLADFGFVGFALFGLAFAAFGKIIYRWQELQQFRREWAYAQKEGIWVY